MCVCVAECDDLCDPPLPVNYSSSRQIPNNDHNGSESDGHGLNRFFVCVALGFWVVVAPFSFIDHGGTPTLRSCWRL